MARLFMLLREVAWTEGRHTDAAVATQLDRLWRLLDATDLDPIDRGLLETEADRVTEAIEGRWDQTGRSH